MAIQPLVSIVMPSFNQARFIEEALDSILTQSWTKLEVIVQDGGSTDGTLEILTRKSKEDPRILWRSEPDNGPADAINKAFVRTRGTIIGWLNSDDLYKPDAIKRAVNTLSDSKIVMCYGKGLHIDEFGNFMEIYPTQPDGVNSVEIPSINKFQDGCFICQPTVFFKRTVLRLLGNLNNQVKASFDYEYWLRLFNVFSNRIDFINSFQAATRMYNGTITSNHRLTIALEGIELTNKYLGLAKAHWIISYIDEQMSLGIPKKNIKIRLNKENKNLSEFLSEDEYQKIRDLLF